MTGWLVVGLLWHDRALIVLNAISVGIYATGIVNSWFGDEKSILYRQRQKQKAFDLEKLRPHGKIYVAMPYRDFKPDVLISVDNGIMHEIYQSGFAKEVECWFRNWTKVPDSLQYDVICRFKFK